MWFHPPNRRSVRIRRSRCCYSSYLHLPQATASAIGVRGCIGSAQCQTQVGTPDWKFSSTTPVTVVPLLSAVNSADMIHLNAVIQISSREIQAIAVQAQ